MRTHPHATVSVFSNFKRNGIAFSLFICAFDLIETSFVFENEINFQTFIRKHKVHFSVLLTLKWAR